MKKLTPSELLQDVLVGLLPLILAGLFYGFYLLLQILGIK